jgi:cell division septum initiation protein DivIVA
MSEIPVLKSYKRKEVDEFLLRLNEAHINALAEKDDEIKRLYSELEFYKTECQKKEAEVASVKAEYEELLETKQKETDAINARLGEKFSAAESAASAILDEAKAEKAKIISIAKSDAENYVAKAIVKAEEYTEKAKQLSLIYRDYFQKANQSLELMNKHLDTAVEEMSRFLAEPQI